MNIIINGSEGKMGAALMACVPNHPGITVVSHIDIGNDIASVIQYCDVVVDFSSHTATANLVELCALHKKPIVIGTTGHTEDESVSLEGAASRTIPIVKATNFSTGVNVLFWLTRKAAEIFGPDFDLEIVEMHHRLKKDAPSGTAKTLAEILARVRKQQFDAVADAMKALSIKKAYGRCGEVGVRPSNEVGIHSIRGGDVVGDHTVIFAGIGERVELTHKASSRETFANGALRAAEWVVNQKPGLYDMMDVLGLK